MNRFALTAITLIAAAALPAQDDAAKPASHAEWIADFDQAAAMARKDGKDLLVDFTGSDWCGWCKRLHSEVFAHEQFHAGVDEYFVLVALDFPHSDEAKAKVPNPERNAELQKKYGIRGFPTILLMTPDGEVFGKTGYQKGGPEKYVASLDEMRTTGKRDLAEIKDLSAKFAAAEGPARDAVIALAVDKLTGMKADAAGIKQLAGIAKNALSSADEAVVTAATKALLTSGQADAECCAKAKALDPKNEKGLFELVVDSKMKQVMDDTSAKAFLAALDELVELDAQDADLFEGMLARAASWSFGPLKNKEGAVKYANLLKAKAKDASKYEKLFKQILGDG